MSDQELIYRLSIMSASDLIEYLTDQPDTPHLQVAKARSEQLTKEAYALQRLIVAIEDNK